MTAVSHSHATVHAGRPRFEGANIRTWIGFKHFLYLVEEAVLDHLRGNGLVPSELYLRHGLGVEIVDTSVQLPATLEIDDETFVTVTPIGPGTYRVLMRARRGDAEFTALKGKVRVAFVAEQAAADSVPEHIVPLVVSGISSASSDDVPAASGTVLGAPGQFVWSWRVPYFYCHYSARMQHSGYVRALEEVVDRYLDACGLPIGVLLAERAWIPVVSRARVRLLADALLGEQIHVVFRVGEILKDTVFTGQMDCFVRRDGQVVHTATATILHGYAISRGPRAGTVAVLDADTQRRLMTGGTR